MMQEAGQGSVEESSTPEALAAGLSAALLQELPPDVLKQVMQVQDATLASLKASRQSISQQTKELNALANKLSASVSTQAHTFHDIRANMDQLYALARQARRALQNAGIEVAEPDIEV